MTRTMKMTEGRPLRLLLSFALPLMFGNIFQQLYTVVDTAVVGRGVGMDALREFGIRYYEKFLTLEDKKKVFLEKSSPDSAMCTDIENL